MSLPFTWSCVSLPRSTTSSDWKYVLYVKFKSQHISVFQDWKHISFLTTGYRELVIQLLIKTQNVYRSWHQCSKGCHQRISQNADSAHFQPTPHCLETLAITRSALHDHLAPLVKQDWPRTTSRDISLDCHIWIYRGIIMSKIVFLESVTFQLYARMLSSEVTQSLK